MIGLPSLRDLGEDLLAVPVWRRAASLAAPFLLVAAFFALGARGFYAAALACPVALSFLTYASLSHDLVHRNLGLPRWLNELLLAAIELAALRSGHAYRAVHLHHHAHFPEPSDLEGAAARMSWWRALVEGPTLQVRLWLFAMKRPVGSRAWVVVEAALVAALIAGACVATRWTLLPAAYAALMIAGSWIYPFMTAYVPHVATGETALTQTRRFRGRFFSLVALEHLYHLEHHLYPQVPHHRWPELARRLDAAGVFA